MTRLVAPVVLATLLLVACGHDNDDSASVYRQSGETVAVGVGERFAIELDGNPTTGYSWQLSAPPGAQVTLIDSDFTPTGPQQAGTGGVQRFTFEATATGTTSLAFAYVRPWETGVAPADTASFPVKVS
jgi:inhibitor of cysteine peptidase